MLTAVWCDFVLTYRSVLGWTSKNQNPTQIMDITPQQVVSVVVRGAIKMVLLNHSTLLCMISFVTLAGRSWTQNAIHFKQRNQNLTEIPTESIPKDVVCIDVSFNLLQSIPSGSLNTFFQIQELDASHNRISSVANDAFRGTQMTSLWLNNNLLTAVPNLGHIGESLVHLYLQYNQIKQVQGPEFSGVKLLQSFYLYHNELDKFEPAFQKEGSQSLQDMLIHNNRLTEIKSIVFQDMKNLQNLIIKYNQLQTLPDLSSLPEKNNLRYLDARGNAIWTVNSSALSKLTSLVTLFLSGNSLTELPDISHTKETLISLYCSSNYLHTVPEDAFEGFKLRIIGMAYNRLTKMPNLLPLNSSLSYISLSGNKFGGIPCAEMYNFLHTMTALRYLYLDGTGLTTFPDIRDFNRTFTILSILSLETLVCDCTMVWLKEMTSGQGSSLPLLDIRPNSRPCGQPARLRDRKWSTITLGDLCPGES